MAATFHTTILTADRTMYDTEVASLVARGQDGYFGVLAHHAPLIAALVPGKLVVRDGDGREHTFCMSGGLLEVSDNRVRILADSAEFPEEIDYERACAAETRARERLSTGFAGEEIDLDRALQALRRAVNRKKIAEEQGHEQSQS